MITIKCDHADGQLDDPFYPFSVDHLRDSVKRLESERTEESEKLLHTVNTLISLIDNAGSEEIAAFASASFHYIDMILGNTRGETFFERLKTLRDGFGEEYFSTVL